MAFRQAQLVGADDDGDITAETGKLERSYIRVAAGQMTYQEAGYVQNVMFVEAEKIELRLPQRESSNVVRGNITEENNNNKPNNNGGALPGSTFVANDPSFETAVAVKGVDIGWKLVSRQYAAQKHVHPRYQHLIAYAQCRSVVETLSHILTFNLSAHRSKVAIFVLDVTPVALDKFNSKLPFKICLKDIKSLIDEHLGPFYECHRRKVPYKELSLYIYLVKESGKPLSEQARQDWSNVFQWTNSQQTSFDGSAGSNPSGLQGIITRWIPSLVHVALVAL